MLIQFMMHNHSIMHNYIMMHNHSIMHNYIMIYNHFIMHTISRCINRCIIVLAWHFFYKSIFSFKKHFKEYLNISILNMAFLLINHINNFWENAWYIGIYGKQKPTHLESVLRLPNANIEASLNVQRLKQLSNYNLELLTMEYVYRIKTNPQGY